MMTEFPPPAERQVTLANWRTPPFNAWAFHHVREIVPSAEIPNAPDDVQRLTSEIRSFDSIDIERPGGGSVSFADFVRDTQTDGLVVLRRGKVAFSYHANGMSEDTPHILMSVSKSILGLIAGILTSRGALDPQRLVTDYVPEVSDTVYRGATVRQLLDMRIGIDFDEDYLATSGPIVDYRKATNWNPLAPGETATDLRSFFRTLTRQSGPHGGPFNYVSTNTDLAGWVIERAAGARFSDLVSELLWKPLGAARPAYITVDRLGAMRCAGGICMTVEDLARVGQLMVQGGARGTRQIVPESWIADITANGDAGAWAEGSFVPYFPGLDIHYRAKWYVLRGDAPMLFGVGIHGQNVFIDPKREIVIAKVSSQAQPLDKELITLTMNAVAAIRRELAD